MKPITRFVIAAFAATTTTTVMAQGQDVFKQGFLADGSGQVIAAAPPPAAVPPSAPEMQKFTFSGDALFAFDKSVLKPEGKVMLDDLVQRLDGATYNTIHAIGHADRFGSNEYNQRLSERRAHAVKDYLVSKNVHASRIDAEGKGETQPVTKAGDCLGAQSSKVIACLRPDRRVDVETNGIETITSSR